MTAGLLVDEASEDRLIRELDGRLEEQGFTKEPYIQVLVDYLRDGWVLMALPKEIVDRYDSSPANEHTLQQLTAELRKRIEEYGL